MAPEYTYYLSIVGFNKIVYNLTLFGIQLEKLYGCTANEFHLQFNDKKTCLRTLQWQIEEFLVGMDIYIELYDMNKVIEWIPAFKTCVFKNGITDIGCKPLKIREYCDSKVTFKDYDCIHDEEQIYDFSMDSFEIVEESISDWFKVDTQTTNDDEIISGIHNMKLSDYENSLILEDISQSQITRMFQELGIE